MHEIIKENLKVSSTQTMNCFHYHILEEIWLHYTPL